MAGQLFKAQQDLYGDYPWTTEELQRIESVGREVQAAIEDGITPPHQLRFRETLERWRLASTPLSVLAAEAGGEGGECQSAEGKTKAFVSIMREAGERDCQRALFVVKNCKHINNRDMKFRCRGLVKPGSGELPIESLPEAIKLVERAQASGIDGQKLAFMFDKVSQTIAGVA